MSPDYRLVVVITGPSGVGKGTLIRELRAEIPELGYSISATTRPARPGEQDGVNYYFLSPEQFAGRVQEHGFIEHAEYAGNQYGTLRSEIDRHVSERQPVLLEIELAGARQIRESVPEALQIFVAPPSMEALRTRLIGRGTDSPEQVEKRLKIAEAEVAARTEFDVQVVNDRLEDATDELTRIIRDRLDQVKRS